MSGSIEHKSTILRGALLLVFSPTLLGFAWHAGTRAREPMLKREKAF